MDIKQQQPTWQPTIFDLFPELDPDGIELEPCVETIEPESIPNWNGWQDNDDEDDPSVQAIIGNQQANDGFFTAKEEHEEIMEAIESQLMVRFSNKKAQSGNCAFFLHAKMNQGIRNGRRKMRSTMGGSDMTMAGGHVLKSFEGGLRV